MCQQRNKQEAQMRIFYQKYEVQLKEKIQRNPSDSKIITELAATMYKIGKFKNSIQNAKKSLALNKKDGEARTLLANSLFQLKEYRDAKNQYQILYSQNQKVQIRIKYALCCQMMGQIAQATKIFQQEYYFHKNNYQVNYHYALHFLLFIKDNDKALFHFKNCIIIDQNQPSAYEQIAAMYFELKNYDQAIKYFELAAEKDFLNEQIYNRLAIALYQNKNYIKAISTCQLSISINPNKIQSYLNLAQIHKTQEYFHQSLNVLKRANELIPNNPDILFKIALVYQQMDQLQQSQIFYQKIIKIDPNHFEANDQIQRIRNLLSLKSLNGQKGITRSQIKEQQQDICVICYENKPEYVCMPCKHKITCFKCSKHQKFKSCPYCRQPLQ